MPDSAAYDQFFFESLPNPERHINRLFTLSALFGLNPAPISRARVLEIGCSTGAHLIAQAERYPDSSFTGIDLSAAQIDEGRGVINELQLKNIELDAVDFQRFTAQNAEFDYIICHGMYSWIPEVLRDALLRKISALLSPTGLAYVSFNCAAVWGRREPIQNLFRHADNPGDSARERLTRARQLLRELRLCLEVSSGKRESRIEEELLRLEHSSDQLLLHEYLSSGFRAFSLVELSALAANAGLYYLADARPRRNYRRFELMLPRSALRNIFKSLSPAEREDIFDAAEAKAFRAAILTKNAAELLPVFSAQRLRDLYVSSPLVPLSGNGAVEDSELFLLGNEEPVEVSIIELRQMLRTLHSCWPRALRVREVLPETAWSEPLAEAIEDLFWRQSIELSFDDFGCCSSLPERPAATPLARLRARRDQTVISLRHEQIDTNDFGRMIIALLDGTRSAGDLAEFTNQAILTGELQIPESAARDASFVRAAIDQLLLEFLERGLIVAR